jgi:hypothetical protein
MAFVTEKDYSGRGEGGELTPQEEVFVQNLAAQCVYDSDKVVRLNSNNGGLANSILKVDNTGNYLVWDSIRWGEIAGILAEQADLQTALDAKVPYTGATQDLDLGINNLKASYIYTLFGFSLGGNGQIEIDNNGFGKMIIGSSNASATAELDINNLTQNRTFYFPDQSGTFALEERSLAYSIALG